MIFTTHDIDTEVGKRAVIYRKPMSPKMAARCEGGKSAGCRCHGILRKKNHSKFRTLQDTFFGEAAPNELDEGIMLSLAIEARDEMAEEDAYETHWKAAHLGE